LPCAKPDTRLLTEAWSQLTGRWIELASIYGLKAAVQLAAVQGCRIAAAIDSDHVGLGVLQ
jgi:hypothetical protein